MTTKKVGRPIGSGLGNYKTNPNQVRKPGVGRPKLILTDEEKEERIMKKRARVLKCYHIKRQEELDRRTKYQEKLDKINLIMINIREQLENENENIIDKIDISNFVKRFI
jgi:hypothetical protein